MSHISPSVDGLSSEEKRAFLAQLLQKKAGESQSFPLSFTQQRLWILDQFASGSRLYTLSKAFSLTGALKVVALEQSFDEVLRRHEILRTIFVVQDGQPTQFITPPEPFALPIVDLQALPETRRDAEALRIATEEAQRPFDLAQGPLARITLLRLGQETHVLLLNMHHIIYDGWSMDVLYKELKVLYAAFCAERPSPLPELPVQYADFAVWQQQQLQDDALEVQLAYWRQQLEGASAVLELPTDRLRPSVQTFRGAREFFTLPRALVKALEDLSQREGVTLFMTLLAAFKTLLFRYTGQEDVIVGTPIAGRTQPELAGLIGFFINTLVLRTTLSGNPSFREVLKRVRKVALGAYSHQDLPFGRLVEELQPERTLSHSPLFQVVFSFMDASYVAPEFAGLTVRRLKIESEIAHYDLTFEMSRAPEELGGMIEYNSDLFDTATITRMLKHFQTLLGSIVAGPERRISDLSLLTDGERRQLLMEWNDTGKEYAQDVCIHELFEMQVEQTPDAVAAAFENTSLSYRALNQRANQLARYLRKLGVGPEVLVGICMEQSLDMVVGILGILKAGGAYVPLDPTYPQERLALMLEDAQVPVLLTQQRITARLPMFVAQVVCLDTGWGTIAYERVESLPIAAMPENAAYATYTSGSTGKPKGVVITHQALVNYTLAIAQEFDLRPSDRVLQFASLSFDVLVEELFPTWSRSATVVLRGERAPTSGTDLVQMVRQEKLTAFEIPTAFWHQWVYELAQQQGQPPFPLRLVIIGGERALPERVTTWQDFGIPLINVYGLTETTVTSSLYKLSPGTQDQMVWPELPIGRPIPNTQLYILDTYLQPAPTGTVGELYIGGAGLARGYLNQPGLTAERFIPDPFSEQPGARLYKTNDLARYLSDGNIQFFGRADHQVKVRGYRIELGEIESTLCRHPMIREAVVTVREDVPGDKRLAAYLVSSTTTVPSASEIGQFLRTKLPEYMVPSAFVTLSALPLTPTGKVDRRALPAPDRLRPQLETDYKAPQTEIERAIISVWQSVLGLEKVGVYDNFFDVGGNSLLLAMVQNRLRKVLNANVPMVEMFKHPNVHALAKYLNDNQTKGLSIEQSRDQTVTRGESVEGQRPSNGVLSTEAVSIDRSNDFDRRGVAIISMSIRFPGANSVEEFWRNLREGIESISFFSHQELATCGVGAAALNTPNYVKASAILESIELFDASFFGFTPREAEIADPQQRLFLECACEALESAGYNSETYRGRVGVYAGVGRNTYLLNNLLPNHALLESMGLFKTLIGSEKDSLSTTVSYKLNLKGPSFTVQTGCSTSLVATHLACQGLLNDECDVALAGGVRIIVPHKSGYLYEEGGISSPDGHCRAFDAKAKGTVRGNGVGIVVLKRLADALADGDNIYAVIKGSAINNDGALKIGFTAPSVDGQAEVITAALARASVEPETITYVEAHGTGTSLGDPIEIAALTQAFRAQTKKSGFCAIGSVKTNIGHLDTAAGVAGLVKTALALEHKMIPSSLHFEQPNPQIDFVNSPFYVNARLLEWQADGVPRRAGVSSFGVGGTNAHVVLEEAPAIEPSGESRLWQLIVLSAKTDSALETMTTNLIEHLRLHPHLNLADVAYTLQVGRRVFNHRRMVICQDLQDALTCLETRDPKRVVTAYQEPRHRDIVFMFPGQGTQYVNMGLELYQTESTFREQVNICTQLLRPHLGFDLLDVLYPGEGEGEEAARQLKQTAVTQPILFVIEYALAKLWMSWGIAPRVMIGHSIGEYVAACLAGVFSLEEALTLIATRGRLMQELPNGSMLAVSLSEKEVHPLLEKHLSLAVVNGPSSCVVSGPIEAVDQLEAHLAERGVNCRRLHTSHAFHSKMVDPIVEPFTEQVRRVNLKPPEIPFVSNVTGNRITAMEATDPNYWARHLRQTVRFCEGLGTLLEEPDRILLEVGSGRTLSTLAQRHPDKIAETVLLSSLRHPYDQFSDVSFLLDTLGRLWLAGASVDWHGCCARERRHRLSLPTYPFERQRYWIEPGGQGDMAIGLQEKLDEEAPVTGINLDFPPSPHSQSGIRHEYVSPGNEIEQRVVLIWQELFGIEQVSIHDNFFVLGGDSLLATRVIARIQKSFPVDVPLRSLFESPTVAELAKTIEEMLLAKIEELSEDEVQHLV